MDAIVCREEENAVHIREVLGAGAVRGSASGDIPDQHCSDRRAVTLPELDPVAIEVVGCAEEQGSVQVSQVAEARKLGTWVYVFDQIGGLAEAHGCQAGEQ